VLTHAKNNDHASMKDWVTTTAKFLGISVPGASALTIALYLLKSLPK
jgi:hypothetical protein